MNQEYIPATCEQLIALLRVAAVEHSTTTIPPGTASHIVTCADCQLRLLAFFNTLDGLSAAISTCGEIDLAAFVDAEQQDPVRALQVFPQTWAHLWLCDDCLELYTQLHTAADDPEMQLTPLTALRHPPSFNFIFQIKEKALRALPPRHDLVYRGPQNSATTYHVLPYQAANANQPGFRVVAHAGANDGWNFIVQFDQTISGQIQLSMGLYTTQTYISAGNATFQLPSACFESDLLSPIELAVTGSNQ